ncbi:MAG: MGDG synthase family glycosyltransferase [Desulfitobacteriaceae bacterium]
MKNLRVLIFSAKFGSGHVRAAEAIAETIRIKAPTAECIHLDFGSFLNKTFYALVKNTYIKTIKYSPKLWGMFYYRTAKISVHSMVQRFFNGLGSFKLLKEIRALKPDIIVCTYPTVAGVLAHLRSKALLDIPLVTVITDFAVHSQWIHPGIDLYIVGCEEVYEGLVKRGIDPQIIKATGIPVSSRFERSISRETIVKKLGLSPERPTLLVMGGSYGVLPSIKWICEILGSSDLPVQTLIVCGRDKKLYKSLEMAMEGTKNPVRLFGFVENVEELMTAADIIITKAGGLTVSESLAKRIPIVIYKPIPGQEKENARFITKIGGGCVANDQQQLKDVIYDHLEHPTKREKMRFAVEQAYPKKAAERAVEAILQLSEANSSKVKMIG